MKIENIGRHELRVLSEVAAGAVRKALEPYGIKADIGRCQYSNSSTGKLAFELVVEGANVDREQFERYAGLMGLQASDYGRVITLGPDRVYKLVGVEINRPKYPFIGERVPDGKRFKLTDDSVRRALRAGL